MDDSWDIIIASITARLGGVYNLYTSGGDGGSINGNNMHYLVVYKLSLFIYTVYQKGIHSSARECENRSHATASTIVINNNRKGNNYAYFVEMFMNVNTGI